MTSQLCIGRIPHMECEGWVHFARYVEGDGVAITIKSDRGEPLYKATVNLEDSLAPDLTAHQVWIKTWSENDGLLEVLEAAKVLTRGPAIWAVSGHAVAILCDLTPEAVAEFERQMAAAESASDLMPDKEPLDG